MAFVIFNDIMNLVPEGIKSHLMKSDIFTNIESEAGKIVTEITAVASPADIADRPDWVVQPMAFIMTKLLALQMSQSEEFLKAVKDNYNLAIEFLNSKKAKGATTEIVWGVADTLDNLTEI